MARKHVCSRIYEVYSLTAHLAPLLRIHTPSINTYFVLAPHTHYFGKQAALHQLTLSELHHKPLAHDNSPQTFGLTLCSYRFFQSHCVGVLFNTHHLRYPISYTADFSDHKSVIISTHFPSTSSLLQLRQLTLRLFEVSFLALIMLEPFTKTFGTA